MLLGFGIRIPYSIALLNSDGFSHAPFTLATEVTVPKNYAGNGEFIGSTTILIFTKMMGLATSKLSKNNHMLKNDQSLPTLMLVMFKLG